MLLGEMRHWLLHSETSETDWEHLPHETSAETYANKRGPELGDFIHRVLCNAGQVSLSGCFQVASRLPEHAARYAASRESFTTSSTGTLRRDALGDDFIAVDAMSVDALAGGRHVLDTEVTATTVWLFTPSALLGLQLSACTVQLPVSSPQ